MRHHVFSIALFLPVFAGCVTPVSETNRAGVALYRDGRFEAAREHFAQALEWAPGDGDIAFNLASAHDRLGQHEQAIWYYRQAIERDVNHALAHHALGRLLVSRGKADAARDDVEAWLAAAPESADAHVEMAWLARQTADARRARVELRRALVLQPFHPGALFALGVVEEEAGNRAAAIAFFERSLACDRGAKPAAARLARLRAAKPDGVMAVAGEESPRK